MGDIAAYILMFSLGFGALYAYKQRKLRTRHVRISVQHYPECILKVLLEKKHGKQHSVIIRIMSKTKLQLRNVQLELIDRRRNIQVIHLDTVDPALKVPENIDTSKYFDLILPFETMKELMEAEKALRHNFRLVVENRKGKKYKSHELTINKKGHLYKPDTGRYN